MAKLTAPKAKEDAAAVFGALERAGAVDLPY
jgi:hypothetical protein